MQGLRIAGIALVALAVAACQPKEKVKTIKLAHGLSTTHPVHVAMEFMGDRLAEKSDGKMALEVYPSEQLGSERECLELLQFGALGMTKVSAAVLENFSPQFKVFGLPYIFTSRDHQKTVLDSQVGSQILSSMDQYQLVGVCYYDSGSRNFYTVDTKVTTPDDIAGKKIRVMTSPTAIAMVKSLGGSATPLAWGELYSALQQGIVDGAENNLPSFYLSHHYEQCKYYILDEHTMVPDVVVMSKKVHDELSPEERQWLMEAAQESVDYQRQLWSQSEKESLDAIIAAGVEVLEVDKTPFIQQSASVREEYGQDPVLSDLMDKISKLEP